MRQFPSFTCLGVALILAGCGGDTPTVPSTVDRISVSATTVSLEAIGASVSLAAQALDARGRSMSGASVTWTTSNPEVASVSGGVITAVNNGTATIQAIAGSASASISVSVQQIASTIAIATAGDTLYSLGDTARVIVALRDARGNLMANAADGSLRYSTTTPSVLSIDSTGLVTALAAGEGAVRVTRSGLTGERTMFIRPRAARLAIVQQPRVARAGEVIDTAVIVHVHDSRGNRVDRDAGTPITLTLAGVADGITAGGTAVTVNGEARFGQLVVGALARRYVLHVASPGVAPAISDSVDLRPGVPARLRARSDTSVTALAGTVLREPLRLQTQDAWGNVAPAGRVRFRRVSGEGTLSDTLATSDTSGEARVGFTFGRRAGLALIEAALDSARLTFRLTATPNGVISGTVTSAAGAASSARAAGRTDLATLTRDALLHRRVDLDAPAVPDELLVTLRPAAGGAAAALLDDARTVTRSPAVIRQVQQELRAALEGAEMRSLVRVTGISPMTLTARVRVQPGQTRSVAMARLSSAPQVLHVEPNYLVNTTRERRGALTSHLVMFTRTSAPASAARLGVSARVLTAFPRDGFYPSDHRYVEQSWHYNVIGLPQAWTVSRGSDAVLVAVVDDGIRFDHPAMTGQLTNDGYDFVSVRTHPRCGGGTVSANGDGDGVDPDPTSPAGWIGTSSCASALDDDGNHGLHVAATISATPGNPTGVAGGTATTRIRPVRAFSTVGNGTTYDIAQAILYAAGLPADNGAGGTVTAAGGAAHIINMSFGGPAPSVTQADAIRRAAATGALLVAASGNSASAAPSYPAAFPEVLAVSAVSPALTRATYSSASSTIGIAAPGGQVSLGESYGVRSASWNFVTGTPRSGSWNGTSMAAPHVSAVAALLKATSPALGGAELRARLTATATDLGASGADPIFGAGLVNADRALRGEQARRTIVLLVNAQTGAEVARTVASSSGAYRFGGLPDGPYWVFAGSDVAADGFVGMPGRDWTAAGGATTPTRVIIDGAHEHPLSFALQTPTEREPNDDATTANVLFAGGYAMGSITALTDTDWYTLLVSVPGTYVVSVTGQQGACGFAVEANPQLLLADSSGVTRAEDDDVDVAAFNYCARITTSLGVGSYRVRIRGSRAGNYLVRAVRQP